MALLNQLAILVVLLKSKITPCARLSFAALSYRMNEGANTYHRDKMEGWVTVGLMLLWAAASAYVSRDTDYDVSHYHVYIGWAAAYDRLGTDWAPANLHSFFNPYFQMLAWILIEALPGRIVAFILGFIHAIQIPVLFGLTRKLFEHFESYNFWGVLFVTLIAFLSAGNFGLIGSLRNDHIGATAFMLAIWLVISRFPQQPHIFLAMAGLIMGMAFGLKPTNGPYAIALAICVACLQRNPLRAANRLFILAGYGLLGTILTGGVWYFKLWQGYGNPLFPNFPELFPSQLTSTEFSSYHMWAPGSLWGVLIDPFIATFKPLSVNENSFTDYRALIGYFSAIALIISAIRLFLIRQTLSSTQKDQARLMAALGISYLALFLIWSATFSVFRYGHALWGMGIPMAAVVLLNFKPLLSKNKLRISLIVALGILVLATTMPPIHKRAPWTSWQEPYLTATIPNMPELENSIVVFAGPESGTFIAPFLPQSTIFTNLVPQEWTEPLLSPYRKDVVSRIKNHKKSTFIIVAKTEHFQPTLDLLHERHSIGVDPVSCKRIYTSFDNILNHWVICPATPV